MFLENSSIKSIAKVLRNKGISTQLETSNEISRVNDDVTVLPASDAQSRLWTEEEMNPGLSRYNTCSQRKFTGALNIDALKQALLYVVERHEPLRTIFIMSDSILCQSIQPAPIGLVNVIDLRYHTSEDSDSTISAFLESERRRPFHLAHGIPFRAAIVQTPDPNVHFLSLVVHHIATDGWSSQLLERDLAAAYHSFKRLCCPPMIKPLAIRYRDYTMWQKEQLTDSLIAAQMEYWSNQLRGKAALEMPTDFKRPQTLSDRAGEVSFDIDMITSNTLRDIAALHGTSLYVTFLALFRISIYRTTGQEDGTLGMVNANRPHPELESIVGFFVNTQALRLQIDDLTTFNDLVMQTRRTAAEAMQHSLVPFDKIVAHISPDRSVSRNPLVQLSESKNVYGEFGLNYVSSACFTRL